jgi:hypothetical protein
MQPRLAGGRWYGDCVCIQERLYSHNFPKEKNMDVPPTEEQIRNLAYRLWEEAGAPEGRSHDFWVQAQQQLTSEPGMGEGSTGAPQSDPAVSK